MSLRVWLRPPRRLIALFILLTLVPALLLLAFGWRLLEQDRALEIEQMRDAREQAAAVIAGALEQQIAGIETMLRSGSTPAVIRERADAVVMVLTPGVMTVLPSNRLLFRPAAVQGPQAADGVFQEGEQLEFVMRDLRGAAGVYRSLARGPSAPVRAGALIRLARVQSATGEDDAALETYQRAAALRAASVSGVPIDLLARWARCVLLERLQRRTELRAEGGMLLDDLLAATWPLNRAQFDAHFDDAVRWSGRADTQESASPAIALSEAAAALHDRLRQSRLPPRGRMVLHYQDRSFVLLWQAGADRVGAMAAGPAFVREEWLARLSWLETRHRVRLILRDASERLPAGVVARTAAETGLPWTLLFQPHDSDLPGRFAGRRVLWLAGLGCVILLIASGTYVVGRAVTRELAVARLQNDFVAAVSHEFRTPLTSLRQLTEMLIERPPDPDRARTYYDMLGRQTDRLHRFVENLLDFGRMEARTSPYRLEPMDAVALAADVGRLFEADPAARQHRVLFETQVASAPVAGDRDALARALWNLLDNAAKYSPRADCIWLTAEQHGAALEIKVRDAGLGVPTSEQREIFGKFVRGASARAEHIGGTGIGLALVQHIAVAHRGSIAIASEPGAGSTFTLRLPLLAHGVLIREGPACLES